MTDTPLTPAAAEARAMLAQEDEITALRAVLRDLIRWSTKFPSHRIYSDGQIQTIARELDGIVDAARIALAGRA